MNLIKLNDILKNNSIPRFREAQIKRAFFKDLVDSWEEVKVLPKALREQLNVLMRWDSLILAELISDNKTSTRKALFKLHDGLMIETVLMGHRDGRYTVCVSSQAGCPLGCTFCATGQTGYHRNLTAEEIIDQVIFFARILKKENSKVSNVVLMGMGEPFLNYDNVIRAIDIMNDPELFGLGARHISISTIGIPRAIRKLAEDQPQVNLAFSLHAPNDELRSRLIPANRQYPLDNVLRALDDYIDKANRRVMIEYLMIDGVNDGEKEALELAELLKNRKLAYVNLIKYHKTSIYRPSSEKSIKYFMEILKKNHVQATRRFSFGESISAACGQLAGNR